MVAVAPSAKTHNVVTEENDARSILSVYKTILALRHSEPALIEGDYVSVNDDDPNVYAYLRRYRNQALLVALNFSNAERSAKFDLTPQGFSSAKQEAILMSGAGAMHANYITLEPFGFYIGKLTK